MKTKNRFGSWLLVACALGMLGLWWWDDARRAVDDEAKSASEADSTVVAPGPKSHVRPQQDFQAPPAMQTSAVPNVDEGNDPPLLVPGKSLEGDVEFVVKDLSTALQATLDDEERFPELAACRKSKGDCAALESKALENSLAWPLVPELAVRKHGVDSLLQTRPVAEVIKEVSSSAERILTTSTDPSERAAALALLERVRPEAPELPPLPLAAAAYKGLSERPDPEVLMLLRSYQNARPEGEEVATAIKQLALDPSRPVPLRAQAVRTLGQAATGAQLEQVVAELRTNQGVSSAMARGTIGPALAGCGAACTASFESLAKSTQASERIAAQYAITFCKDKATRESWFAALRSSLPPSDQLLQAERDQIAYLARTL